MVLIKNGCKQTSTERPFYVSRKMNECSDQTLNDTSELICFLWAYGVALKKCSNCVRSESYPEKLEQTTHKKKKGGGHLYHYVK